MGTNNIYNNINNRHQALELTAQATSEQPATSLPSHAHPDRELRRPWSDQRRRARRHHPRPPLRKPQPQAKGGLLSCVPNSTTLPRPMDARLSSHLHHTTSPTQHTSLHHFISLHPLHHFTPSHPPTSPLHSTSPHSPLHLTTRNAQDNNNK